MSRSWMTGGGRIGRSAVKSRHGIVASRLEAPLRDGPRRPLTLWERFRVRMELLASFIDEWKARRRIRRAQK